MINYHFKCRGTQLTHLYFVFNLLIIFEGSLKSVQAVLSIPQDLKDKADPCISIQKNYFFSAGHTPSETSQVSISTGLYHAILPVRYLGVPLCTRKPNLANYVTLLQRIKGRMSTQATRSLSFPGRNQLLTFVIARITNFRTSTFILPKSCIKHINFMCSAFL